jgi:hypothetical protein
MECGINNFNCLIEVDGKQKQSAKKKNDPFGLD